MKSFEHEVKEFEQSLNSFVLKFKLPVGEWFRHPDHLAIKCADRQNFLRTVNYWRASAIDNAISGTDMHDRTLATAHLKVPEQVGAYGTVEWLEIMEPRPEKVGKGLVGLEHIEFYFPYFERVRPVLEEAGIAFEEPQDNEHHKCIVIQFNEIGQEFKLNDYPLGKIVANELAEGTSYRL